MKGKMMKYEINTDICVQCGECAEVCPRQAIVKDNVFRVVREICVRCGLCESVCPVSAVKSVTEPPRAVKKMPERKKNNIASDTHPVLKMLMRPRFMRYFFWAFGLLLSLYFLICGMMHMRGDSEE